MTVTAEVATKRASWKTDERPDAVAQGIISSEQNTAMVTAKIIMAALAGEVPVRRPTPRRIRDQRVPRYPLPRCTRMSLAMATTVFLCSCLAAHRGG
ncbi:hypothetical protein GCM10009672_24120 [Nesterenkonia lutea]